MRFCLTWLLIGVLFSCNSNGKEHQAREQAISDSLLLIEMAGNFSNVQDIQLDSIAIDQFIKTYEHFETFRKDIFRFYINRNYAMAWFDSTGMIEQAGLLYNRIIHMKDEGLPLDIPYMDEYIAGMLSVDESNKIFTELMQTAQYLHFAQKLISGISEVEIKSLEWNIPRKKTDHARLLQQFLEGDSSSMMQHFFPQYYLLKNKLAEYHQIENDGGWDSIVIEKDNSLG